MFDFVWQGKDSYFFRNSILGAYFPPIPIYNIYKAQPSLGGRQNGGDFLLFMGSADFQRVTKKLQKKCNFFWRNACRFQKSRYLCIRN